MGTSTTSDQDYEEAPRQSDTDELWDLSMEGLYDPHGKLAELTG